MAVGFDGGGCAPGDGVGGAGIDGDDDFSRCGDLGDAIDQLLGDEALAVVLQDDGVEIGQALLDGGGGGGELGVGELGAAFAVDADDLLVAGDDTGFDGGGGIWAALDTADVEPPFFEDADQLIAFGVVTGDAHDGNRGGEGQQVAGDVGSASGVEFVAFDFDHRNRGFWGNPRHSAP